MATTLPSGAGDDGAGASSEKSARCWRSAWRDAAGYLRNPLSTATGSSHGCRPLRGGYGKLQPRQPLYIYMRNVAIGSNSKFLHASARRGCHVCLLCNAASRSAYMGSSSIAKHIPYRSRLLAYVSSPYFELNILLSSAGAAGRLHIRCSL